VNITDVWKGERNPVRYVAIEDLALTLDPEMRADMPPPASAEQSSATPEDFHGVGALTMAQLKKGLALTL
jgi:hypothetical protein